MNKFIFKPLYIFALLAFVFTSCNNDDDPAPVNEEEEITTLTITFTETGTSNTVAYTFKDLDGDGGNAPEITNTGGNLKANTDYTAAITILNENETPVEDKTAEIRAEDDEHQFFFDYGNLFSAFAYTDTDGTNPVGLASSWTTAAAGTGNLKVTLRHKPNKGAAGVSAGDITNAGGETDIEVTFSVTVE